MSPPLALLEDQQRLAVFDGLGIGDEDLLDGAGARIGDGFLDDAPVDHADRHGDRVGRQDRQAQGEDDGDDGEQHGDSKGPLSHDAKLAVPESGRRHPQAWLMPPPPEDVAPAMRELVSSLREEEAIHPVLVAGIAQFQLVHIHPFLDGNGRTSRLLSTLCLYRAGYDFKRLFALSDRDRTAFYRAIQGVRERDMDPTGWLEYFVEGLAIQLAEVKSRGEIAIRSDVLSAQRGLNSRQAAALDHVLAHRRLVIADLQNLFPEVSLRSLRRDVKALLELGLVKEVGSGPTDPSRHYVAGEL